METEMKGELLWKKLFICETSKLKKKKTEDKRVV